MSPELLARNNTESGHQKALFAWAAMARNWGFSAANDMDAYKSDVSPIHRHGEDSVPELRWLHSIPNGGARDPSTAARMKAEGVKAGVYDVFLPVPRKGGAAFNGTDWVKHGLYIELKRIGKLSHTSDEQRDFSKHCVEQGYANFVCAGWRDAADVIKRYLGE